jgi:16S rRNA (uracil1498-N3)-methyltransferase
MRVIRCHVDAALSPGAVLRLPEEKSLHLLRVLRLREGDGVALFNGDGHDYAARITGSERKAVEVTVDAAEPRANESPLAITLLQGVARGDKMDLILQKATELGVQAIQPVMTERTEVKLDAERAERRIAHWRGVVAAACEQSGRARVPSVAEPRALHEAVAALPGDARRLILDPHRGRALKRLDIDVAQPVVLVIGPEGGLGERDHKLLDKSGFEGVQLGPRVLRTETAGLAVLAALQALYGDWA